MWGSFQNAWAPGALQYMTKMGVFPNLEVPLRCTPYSKDYSIMGSTVGSSVFIDTIILGNLLGIPVVQNCQVA